MPFIAYFFVLVLTAVTAAVSLDYLTAPGAPPPKHDSAKVANSAGTAVRQVPLGKSTRETTAQASTSDDDKSLTPLYPAAPGKNLPDAQSADAAGTKSSDDAKPANASAANALPQPSSTQSANAAPAATNAPATNSQPAPSSNNVVQASLPAGACAIDACASAYRSFRPSDCTYQPFGGPRKLCELSPGGAQQAANPPQALPVSQGSLRGGMAGRGRGDDFDDVVRTVRRLPPPTADYADDDDGYDRGRIVVIQREGARPYAGPRYIYEER